MAERLKLSARFPRSLYGTEEYSIVVEVTNLTDKVITDVDVDRQLLPGVPLSLRETPSSSELDELDVQKQKLVTELEAHAHEAYDRQQLRKLSIFQGFVYALASIPTVAASVLTKTSPNIVELPVWAREACRIKEWSDVDRIEELLIKDEPDDSFLRKVFQVDKAKLRACMDRIAQVGGDGAQENLSDTSSIQPGETISFSFRYRAPHLYRRKSFDTQLKVSYKCSDLGVSGSYSVGETVSFEPSYFSVPLGAATGAVVGFLVRAVFLVQSSLGLKPFLAQLGASILLALVVAFATARSQDSKKILTVEDFVGGFVIGALSGLFSERLIQFLNSLVNTWLEKNP